MGEDWDSWASIIRASALTSKTPLTLYEINRDTKMLEGKDIPFKQLNFRSLEEMLRKVPGLKVFQQQGRTVVQAIPKEESAHISKMIRLQKSSKRKPRTLPPVFNRFNTNYRRPPANRASAINVNRTVQSRLSSTPYAGNNSRPIKVTPPTQITPPTPLMQVPVQMPEIVSPQRKVPVPLTLPTTTQASKSVHFTPMPAQQKQSIPPLIQSSIQQRLDVSQSTTTAKTSSSISQRLNVAASRSLPATLAPQIDDPRLRLLSYTQATKLPPPSYKDLPTKNNNIYSAVTVDSKKYSSYPKEAKTKDEAEKLAAQAALDELVGKNKKPTVTTKDKNVIIKRVLDVVDNHPNGLFQSNLEQFYIARYNEGLPNNWLKFVENLITVDIGANNLTILSPQKEEIQRSRPSTPTILEPELLQLDCYDFWLHVYVVYNTTDIWGVIIDENHSDKIDELAKEMKTYYDTDQSTDCTVLPGKFYAIFDSDWWHRGRCIKVDPDTQEATIFFIDRGDEDVFPTSRLRTLHPKFCQLPAQSVRLSLAGLESFEDCSEVQVLLEELLVDKDVFVKKPNFYTRKRYDGMTCAELYLEQDAQEINVNDTIQKEILNKIVDPFRYLGPDKVAQEVHISHVSENGIYVQMKSKGFKYLQILLDNLAILNPKPVSRFNTEKIYILKEEDKWIRVKIESIKNENQASALLLDYGNIVTVQKTDLILLEDLSVFLAKYPNQAIKVQLHKISPIMFDKKMAAHLRQLAPATDVFYMKAVGNVEDTLLVEFYKRTESNLLASLNDTLALEPEITTKDDNNNAKPRLRNDRSSIGTRPEFPLKAPNIPPIGSYFDVEVTMAAHPSNFTVQPFNSSNELNRLMVDLSEACESCRGPALTPSSVIVGNMYAAKYDDDGRWYRAYVSKKISKSTVAVYFCDYGDYRAVSVEQLQPLPNKFYELPYQAIKAKLYGVAPKLKGDWTVKDSLRFNELTVGKQFVSIVKACNVENTSTGEIILSLELIDVETEEDIYISNIFINEKRADKLMEDLKVI